MTMASTTLRQDLELLANEIQSAAPDVAHRLRSLGDAVDGGPDSQIWAAADIFRLIDPDGVADQIRRSGTGDSLVRLLETLRNALVFLPIAITWIGIWLALETYGAAVRADPTLAELSFLFLWQEGFGGRMPLTLSTVALIDGALLTLVFLLTLIVLARSSQKERQAEQIRDDLAGVLADASLVLTARNSRNNAGLVFQFERAADGLLTELQQERLRIQDLAGRKEKELDDLSTLARDFMTSTQGMLTVVQALQSVPTQMSQILRELTTSFQQLIAQERDEQQEFAATTRQAAAHLKLLTDAHRASSVDMQALGTNLHTMGTSMQTMGRDLRDAIGMSQRVVSQQAQAVADMRLLVEQVTTAQSRFLSVLMQERTGLEQSTQTMQDTVQALQHSYQSLDQSFANLAQLLQQLTGQQQDFAQVTHQAALQFRQLTDGQAAAGMQLQAMGINLQKMGVDLRSAIDALQTTLTETAQATSEMSRLLPNIMRLQTQLVSVLRSQPARDEAPTR